MKLSSNTGDGKMDRIKIGRHVLQKEVLDFPYIIAEIGVNHEGDIERAKEMIHEIGMAGGHAVKFQAYKAGTLASKHSPAYWDTEKETCRSQFELFKKHDKFWKTEFEYLADYCNQCDVDFLATPFDKESVDFLEPLVPAYKIASADITNKPFLKYIARKEKPILLSTGASTMSEIWSAIEWIKEEGNDEIVLLHCVLTYPTDYDNANLGSIKYMNDHFPDFIIGYSDHTLPEHMDEVLISAWLLGARVIEKHYTWNKSIPGNDHYHSMDYHDLRRIIERFEFIRKLIGRYAKTYTNGEEVSRKYARRSIVAARHIEKGKLIEPEDLAIKRPGTGIPPSMFDNLIGAVAIEDIATDEILTFEKIRMKSRD